MLFRMKRVRWDLVGKKFGLMKEKFVAASAAVSTIPLLWMPLRLEIQIKVTEKGMEDEVARRVWTRVTKAWKEYTLEMAGRTGSEFAMIRKDFHEALKNGLEFDS